MCGRDSVESGFIVQNRGYVRHTAALPSCSGCQTMLPFAVSGVTFVGGRQRGFFGDLSLPCGIHSTKTEHFRLRSETVEKLSGRDCGTDVYDGISDPVGNFFTILAVVDGTRKTCISICSFCVKVVLEINECVLFGFIVPVESGAGPTTLAPTCALVQQDMRAWRRMASIIL